MSNSNYEMRIQTVCLVMLTTVTFAATLYVMEPVIVPFILAAFLSLVLIPIVDFLIRKLRVPRSIALVLTLCMGFLVMAGLGSLIAVSVNQFKQNAPEYEAQLTKLIEKAERSLPVDRILGLISGTPGSVSDGSEKVFTPGVETTVVSDQATSSFDSSTFLPAGAINGLATQLSLGVLSILSKSMVVMLFTAFLLTGSTTRRKARTGVLGEIEMRVQKYIGIKILLSLVTGFLVFLILKMLGVDYAMSFGVFAFMLNFIPNVGSLVATLLPIPIVALTPNVSAVTVILALLLPLMVQTVIGNVLEPKIMGDTLGLHPVVILMSLIFWGMLWGFPGMLLAAPMSSIAKIVFERIEIMKPVASLMGGRLEAINEMAE